MISHTWATLAYGCLQLKMQEMIDSQFDTHLITWEMRPKVENTFEGSALYI